jgi:hypothetical protein
MNVIPRVAGAHTITATITRTMAGLTTALQVAPVKRVSPCGPSQHPKTREIDESLVNGESYRNIALRQKHSFIFSAVSP